MTAEPETHRAGAWGADLPLNEDEARERLLAAAEACYAERGPTRTRMGDIARRAGVNRSTVYYYFPNKDAVLVAAFVRALAGVLTAAEECWTTDEPFLDQLVAACLVGNEAARTSPTTRLLIDGDEVGHTFHAAQASELWRDRLAGTLGQRIARAAAAGEVRDDLSPESLARWVTRVNFSLMAEPPSPEDGGEEGMLRHLLARSLEPRPKKG
ncbi:TetR/AcrR family transcriptional regulator [Mycolicibacterium sp.]|uniref:TetR/AcrR family transcriptional regulator n=1 Tax=Mycolicibacterium sp. TaxID=2320850 RepID=UPI001A33B775|nr:TetR/AcrR family transcriptional regulator [Mycolicibacterium sp.]MBJ7336808.1 TetR/AcrR family transcriptional regulator [Mycolicibacterium sp.]